MYCTNCGQQFEGNFCPNCGTKAVANTSQVTAVNEYQPNTATVSQKAHTERPKLNTRLLWKIIGCIVLFTFVLQYLSGFINNVNTASAWQDKDYPSGRVKALNSVLSKSELENIASITPSVTNDNEVTMVAGKYEQITYLVVFDGNEVSKITSKYGTIYNNDTVNESYFYWENRSDLEFEIEAQLYVKKFLKAPSSADFSDLCTCERETDKVTVKSSVTSENSFGVPVSSSYTAIIEQSPNKPDEYTLSYLKIGDEIMVAD